MKVSIVIPTLNEATGIVASLQTMQVWREKCIELILVDGGSTDTTVELAKPWVDLIVASKPGRALQMNAGAKQATGNCLLFLHADTQLSVNGLNQLNVALAKGAQWGRFDVQIVGQSFMLRVVSSCMNQRSKLTSIATGDQAIFVRRALFECIGGFPDQVLMEDIALSNVLRQKYKPVCLPGPALTSGRRWESNGVWKTIFLMWRLRWLYWRGVEPAKLKELYK